MAESRYQETCVDNNMERRFAEEEPYEDANAYEAVEAGQPPALPPPRPTNPPQQVVSNHQEDKKNGQKSLTIAFVVTTVIFAGMFAAVIVLMVTPSDVKKITDDFKRMEERNLFLENQISKLNDSINSMPSLLRQVSKPMEERNLFLENQISKLNDSINSMPSLLRQDFSEMNEKYGNIMEQINNMNQSLSQTRSEVNFLNEELVCILGLNGIAYNESCLWAEEAPKRMTLEAALQTCNKKAPSKLPEIYGEEEYLKIMGFLRSKISDSRSIHTWTGMRRNITTGKALLSDGSVAPYTKPRSRAFAWSNAEAKRTHVDLIARPDPNDTDNGMGAIWPSKDFSSDEKVVLCQKL